MNTELTIGQRLKEWRERLGMSQTEFAAAAGVTRPTQFNYEDGRRLPDAAYLVAIRRLGIDISYVLFGEADPGPRWVLTADEGLLLRLYREATADRRAATLGALMGVAAPKSRIVFKGQVGQQVGSQQLGDLTINMPGAPPQKRAAKPPKKTQK